MTQEEIIDLLTDAINDSFDQDWTARDGACAIFNALLAARRYAEGLLPLMADDQARIDAAWEIHKAAGPDDHPNAEDYRNRAERAEAELAEVWAHISAIIETGNVMAEELAYFSEFARNQFAFEGDYDAAPLAIHAWEYARAALNGGKHD